MEFSGKLTDDDWKDVGSLTRSKLYWVRLVLVNWYGIALIAVWMWATVAGLRGDTTPNWPAMGIIWAVIFGVFAWAAIRVKRSRASEGARRHAILPDTIRFTSQGVAWEGPDGETGFRPWRQFDGWRQGRRVIVLDRPQVKCSVIVSIADLSDIERQRVSQFLRANVAQPRQ